MEQPDLLIRNMQDGDEKAFNEIYRRYSESIFGIIYSIVLDQTIAEEVLQDVFMKIWNKAKDYNQNKGRFFTWVLNIARNAAIDETRSKAFKNTKKNLSTTNFVDIIISNENLDAKTNSIGIKAFVKGLKPACIAIIELLYFKGYTQVDAAKELKMPLGTLKTRNRNCISDLRLKVLG